MLMLTLLLSVCHPQGPLSPYPNPPTLTHLTPLHPTSNPSHSTDVGDKINLIFSISEEGNNNSEGEPFA